MTGTTPDIEALAKRLDKFLTSDWKRSDVPDEVAELVADAADRITELEKALRESHDALVASVRWMRATERPNAANSIQRAVDAARAALDASSEVATSGQNKLHMTTSE